MNTKKKRTFIHFLPVYGCIATGIIYAAIGVIAILSFLKIRHGGADESSMMAILNVAVATICYGIFLFVQGMKYDTDKD